MMTTHSLALDRDSAPCWPWLTAAAEMAARACPGRPPPGPHGLLAQSRFPRVATRTVGDLASVAAGRGYARSTLQRWGLARRCDDVTVVVSELLSNALRHARPRHGGWPVRLGMLQLWPGSVLCAVSDPSSAPPVLRPASHLAESGRGLHVVEEFSDRWGYAASERRGKVVWAAFDAVTSPAGSENAADTAAGRRA
jgi:anti-sigma regulatory factor (Ser/Thr protein kinase)